MKKNGQRAVAFTAAAIGSVLAVASSAFACGQWVGKLTVTGNGPLVGTGQSVSVGSGSGMTRCAGATLQKDAAIEATEDGTLTPTGSVTVNVAPATSADCTTPSQFPAGLYTVNILHERVRLATNFQDCMNGLAYTGGGSPGSGVGYPIGHIVVDGSGNGAGVYNNVVGPTDTGKSLLCVSDPVGDKNNQVQVWFL